MQLGLVRRLVGYLPTGRPLSEEDWARRHRAIRWVLLLHVAVVLAYAAAVRAPLWAAALGAGPLLLMWWLSDLPRCGRRFRACLTTFGLMTASSVLVLLSGGVIEMHFHFFVMLSVAVFYQDWATFLVATMYVLVDHAVVGVLDPSLIYNHAEALREPIEWALVHALFISASGAAAVINWRLAERAAETTSRLTDRLRFQAAHDALTGALHRAEFDRRVARVMRARRAAPDAPAAHTVWVFDLDRFKIVNDTGGHAAGDAVLRQLAGLVRTMLPQQALLARLGGDEFGVLLPDHPVDEALEVADAVRAAVIRHRFIHEGRSYQVGVSIGIAEITASQPVDEALRAADAACLAAKEGGRDRVHVYRPDDTALAERRGASDWARRIMDAIKEDAFELHYQPIVPVPSTGVGAFGELLVRLREADGGLTFPGAFMPAAERYDLLPAIDRWVVHTAFGTLGSAYNGGLIGPNDLFSINLSGAAVGDPTFHQFVRDRIEQFSVRASMVCFEITETIAIHNLEAAVTLISDLRSLGFRFALDDFGTGLSSFAYLKRLPIDFLKIDGSFVRNMLDDPVDGLMVEAVNRIAHCMGLRTIAEFVENERIVERLRVLGVDFAQGYATGRPRPLRDYLVERLDQVRVEVLRAAAAAAES